MTAGVADFPWLADLEDEVYDILGTPRSSAGNPAYEAREVVRAFNRAQTWLWGGISDQDKNWGLKYYDLSVTANSRVVDLSGLLTGSRTDFRALRHVVELDSSSNEIQEWSTGKVSEAGFRDRAYVLQRDQKQLYLLKTPTSAFTLRAWYNYWPLPLAHGTVVSAGATSLQLADYETKTTGELIGQPIYIFDGTGEGQTGTPTAYDGPTNTCTVATWTTNPSTDSRYTTRPAFQVSARDAFLYATVCFLGEKFYDAERLGGWKQERDRALLRCMEEEVRSDRSTEIVPADPGGFRDFDPWASW